MFWPQRKLTKRTMISYNQNIIANSEMENNNNNTKKRVY